MGSVLHWLTIHKNIRLPDTLRSLTQASFPSMYRLSSRESPFRKLCSITWNSKCCLNSWFFFFCCCPWYFGSISILGLVWLQVKERKCFGLQIKSCQIRCTLLPINLMIMVRTLHLVWFSVQSMFFGFTFGFQFHFISVVRSCVLFSTCFVQPETGELKKLLYNLCQRPIEQYTKQNVLPLKVSFLLR